MSVFTLFKVSVRNRTTCTENVSARIPQEAIPQRHTAPAAYGCGVCQGSRTHWHRHRDECDADTAESGPGQPFRTSGVPAQQCTNSACAWCGIKTHWHRRICELEPEELGEGPMANAIANLLVWRGEGPGNKNAMNEGATKAKELRRHGRPSENGERDDADGGYTSSSEHVNQQSNGERQKIRAELGSRSDDKPTSSVETRRSGLRRNLLGGEELAKPRQVGSQGLSNGRPYSGPTGNDQLRSKTQGWQPSFVSGTSPQPPLSSNARNRKAPFASAGCRRRSSAAAAAEAAAAAVWERSVARQPEFSGPGAGADWNVWTWRSLLA